MNFKFFDPNLIFKNIRGEIVFLYSIRSVFMKDSQMDPDPGGLKSPFVDTTALVINKDFDYIRNNRLFPLNVF